jgi:hypothetical protein
MLPPPEAGGGGGGEEDAAVVVVARVTRAVIGVPAYFTESQRAATVRASELAGVPKVRLLAEPEAAALAYHHYDNGERRRKKGERRRGGKGEDDEENDVDEDSELILVFDLGGGTFDVSILEVGGGLTEVLATMGNNRLGGTDFDMRLAEHLCGLAVEYGRGGGGGGSTKSGRAGGGGGDDDDRGGRRKADDARTPNGNKARGGGGNAGRLIVKDWYRRGSGDVPGIILRAAERVRICLSNQRSADVVLPLTEDGWRRVASSGAHDAGGVVDGVIVGPNFDKSRFETERGMTEGEDYIIATVDRKAFESACIDELRMLLQPLREVAIMARVMLPGEARPSFVENAMADMERRKEEEEEKDDGDYEGDAEVSDFWGSEDDQEGLSEEGMPQNERAWQLSSQMDVKSQKKAQQRGRKRARDVDKRERSFRKAKHSATEDAVTASLLGKRPGGGDGGRGGNRPTASPGSPTASVASGNERVQEGIHGRPLSRVVLVGGATRMPVIARLLEAVVGIVPQRTVNPDEAVALGCAVQVGILDGENDGLLGGVQAVLSPMQAAVMRALAIRERRTAKSGPVAAGGGGASTARGGGIGEIEKTTASGGMMVVDEFDDDEDFY